MIGAVAPTQVSCPRCGGAFHCGVADALPCACTGLQLDTSTLATLRNTYAGCLCLRCLASLQTSAPPATD